MLNEIVIQKSNKLKPEPNWNNSELSTESEEMSW